MVQQQWLGNAENLINDDLNEDDVCQNKKGTTWTYKQGVVLGGVVELYGATHGRCRTPRRGETDRGCRIGQSVAIAEWYLYGTLLVCRDVQPRSSEFQRDLCS